MSTSYLFCFAAKGLQSYVMRGGKLRDMVGATSLIDKLAAEEGLKNWFADAMGIEKVRLIPESPTDVALKALK